MPTPAFLKRYRRQNRSLRRLAQREAANVESWGYRLRLFFTRATLPTIDALAAAVAYGAMALLFTYGTSLVAAAPLDDSDARQVLLTLWEVRAPDNGMPHYVIDRFEGTAWAVLEDEQGKTFLVPRRWLPTNAREGDVVVETGQPPDDDTVSLNLQLDPSARDERLAKLKTQREELPKGPAGDLKL